jgi:hypothetical protein
MATLVLLAVGVGLWAWIGKRKPASTANEAGAGVGEAPLKVQLRVLHYERREGEDVRMGPIGGKSMEALFNDRVVVQVDLSEPGYCYLIGFNFNGKEQLLWPRDGKKKRGDATLVPPLLKRVQCPPLPAAGEKQRGLKLDDDERGGIQAYVVVASRQALPAYAAWKRERAAKIPWRYQAAGPGVWRSDSETLDTVEAGDVRVRASLAAPGRQRAEGKLVG